jgi:hypothetical protein
MRRLAAITVLAGALATTAFVPVPPVPDPDLPINQVCVFARPIDPDNRYCIQVDDD